jgi:hypothetical protein
VTTTTSPPDSMRVVPLSASLSQIERSIRSSSVDAVTAP